MALKNITKQQHNKLHNYIQALNNNNDNRPLWQKASVFQGPQECCSPSLLLTTCTTGRLIM